MDYDLSLSATAAHQFVVSGEQVFSGFLDVEIMYAAFFGKNSELELISCQSDPVLGGRFAYAATLNGINRTHVGEYLELRNPNKLVFTWQVNLVELPVSKICIDIEDKPEGAHLLLTHQLPLNWSSSLTQAEAAWAQFLVDFDQALILKKCSI
ncbi:SRPBCC domain-containing protein [Pedobacter sp. MC2016-24]|uniref:SRPBCC family protein n=1 Tax=Pedobacter sp. MC2016-24 TaxID=2780090 RepID=UPI001880DECA|nr:SRPBCC domain-containing protein [Pedobacter sp. MC2016-24]MBE9599450.1 SRPBCC domain-containing protein [Pedobacter sp. MC2016-24]